MRLLLLTAAAAAALQACDPGWSLRPERRSWQLEPEGARKPGLELTIVDPRLGGLVGSGGTGQQFRIRDNGAEPIRLVAADLVCERRTFSCAVTRFKPQPGLPFVEYYASWDFGEDTLQETLGERCKVVLRFDGARPLEIPYAVVRP